MAIGSEVPIEERTQIEHEIESRLLLYSGKDVSIIKFCIFFSKWQRWVQELFVLILISCLYREGYQGTVQERHRVGEYHGWIFLGVEEGATEAIDDTVGELSMESNATSHFNHERGSIFADGN
jgi:hypothetical protein